MNQSIPLLSMKNFPYSMPYLLIFVNLLLTHNWLPRFLIPLTELIVVKDKIWSASEYEEGSLVEFSLIDEFLLSVLFFLLDVVLGRVFVVDVGFIREIEFRE